MKTKHFSDKESWLANRIGKVTGSRLKELMTKPTNGKKSIGYYRFIADLLRKPDYSEENPMARGNRLEPEAIAKFEEATGKTVDPSLVTWEHDDDPRIAVSPDGFIGATEAVEVKCLGSEYHLQAWDCKEVPKDYKEQSIQYFVVNPKLKILYFCFYDPRLIALDFFFLTIKREDAAEEIKGQLEFQKELLASADQFINQHTF